MNELDREKFIRDDAEFRGFMVSEMSNFKKTLIEHLAEEMETLKVLIKRIESLENWKIQVTAISSAVSVIVGIIINKFL